MVPDDDINPLHFTLRMKEAKSNMDSGEAHPREPLFKNKKKDLHVVINPLSLSFEEGRDSDSVESPYLYPTAMKTQKSRAIPLISARQDIRDQMSRTMPAKSKFFPDSQLRGSDEPARFDSRGIERQSEGEAGIRHKLIIRSPRRDKGPDKWPIKGEASR
jgi:hypothetical protein